MKRFALLLIFLLLPVFAHAGNPLRKVAKDLSRQMAPLKNPRVAVLSFPYHNGKFSSGSSLLSERLTTCLAETKGVRVIERSLIKKLLEEQHLSETGVVDARAAQKIGKIAEVDVVITGTLNDLDNGKTELNLRALKAGTGEIVAAADGVVERTWSDDPRFPKQTAYSSPIFEDEKPISNEAIEIGYPSGNAPRGGTRSASGSRSGPTPSKR